MVSFFLCNLKGQIKTLPADSLESILQNYAVDDAATLPILFNLFDFYRLAGDLNKAEKYLNKISFIDSSSVTSIQKNKVIRYKAKFLALQKKNKESLELLSKLLPIQNSSDSLETLLIKIGNFVQKKNLDSSNYYLEIADKITERVNDTNLIAALLLADANLYKKIRKPDKAISKSLIAYNYIKQNNLDSKKGMALAYIGHSYYLNAQYDSSVYYCNLAIKPLKDFYEFKALSSIHNVVATVYQNSGRLNKAIEHYFEGLRIAETYSIDYLIAAFLYNLGNCHMILKSNEKAELYFKKCYDFSLSKNDLFSHLYAANALADIEFIKNDYDKASEYLARALELTRKLNVQFMLTYVFAGMSEIALINREFTKAQAILDSAKIYASKYKSIETDVTIDRLQAKIYRKLGKTKRAILILENCLKKSRQEKYLESETSLLHALAISYNEDNQIETAIKYFEEEIKLTDSLNISSILESLVNKEMEYEFEKAERITELESEKELFESKQKVEASKKLTYMLALIGIGLTLLILLLYVLNRSKKMKNKLLNEKKNQLETHKEELENLIEKLNEITSELQVSNKTKDRLFSIIAHDLKNPFSVICGYSNLLFDQTLDDETRLEYSRRINFSSRKLVDMVNNLLHWSTTQSGNISYSPKKIIIEQLLNDVLEVGRILADEKQIEILPDYDAKNKTVVYADENMLKVIMQNLLGNAIKYTPEERKIWLGIKPNGKKIKVFVKDCGEGIYPEEIEEIKKAVIGNSKDGTKGERGTGLGLIICKDFIHEHGSELMIDSELGVGSEFSFELEYISN